MSTYVEWEAEQEPQVKAIVRRLRALATDDERLAVIKHFCSECGGRPDCKCWNNE